MAKTVISPGEAWNCKYFDGRGKNGKKALYLPYLSTFLILFEVRRYHKLMYPNLVYVIQGILMGALSFSLLTDAHTDEHSVHIIENLQLQTPTS